MKEYGKNGVRLLVLFMLIKSRVELAIQHQYPNRTFNEAILDDLCMETAYKLVKLGKDEPTEKDTKELLLRLKERL